MWKQKHEMNSLEFITVKTTKKILVLFLVGKEAHMEIKTWQEVHTKWEHSWNVKTFHGFMLVCSLTLYHQGVNISIHNHINAALRLIQFSDLNILWNIFRNGPSASLEFLLSLSANMDWHIIIYVLSQSPEKVMIFLFILMFSSPWLPFLEPVFSPTTFHPKEKKPEKIDNIKKNIFKMKIFCSDNVVISMKKTILFLR